MKYTYRSPIQETASVHPPSTSHAVWPRIRPTAWQWHHRRYQLPWLRPVARCHGQSGSKPGINHAHGRRRSCFLLTYWNGQPRPASVDKSLLRYATSSSSLSSVVARINIAASWLATENWSRGLDVIWTARTSRTEFKTSRTTTAKII